MARADERKRELVVATMLDLLLQLPPEERSTAFRYIRHNGIFCTECGDGSDDRPNRNCQCWNED